MIEFSVLTQSKRSNARLGILKTSHGIVETPAFVPVATQAAVKSLISEQVLQTKTQILIANTLHLHLTPGERTIKAAGGLHRFMDWNHPLMTDSGGFQVFSLGFGKDYGTGKIAKGTRRYAIPVNTQPRSIKITPRGVYFRSPDDGKKLFLGPRQSIRIQQQLGADIMFAFDECTAPFASYAYTKKSLERTHHWAEQCINHRTSKQALFGIVQGGRFKNLRVQSSRFIGSLPFDGFGIGGEFGNNKKVMIAMLNWVVKELPIQKPRHLLGIGHPEDILPIVKSGVDLFDCIVPTHYARHGTAFTSRGRLDLHHAVLLKDRRPLDPNCECRVCEHYTRSYISHLFRAKEITAMALVTFHNLFYFNSLVERIRTAIKRGKL